MADGQRFYSQDEVEGILRLASESVGTSGMTHDQLIQIAGEVGLTPEQVAAAERKFAAQKMQEEVARRDDVLRQQYRMQLRARIWKKMIGVIALLAVFGAMGLTASVNGHELHGFGFLPVLAVIMTITIVKRVVPLLSKDAFELSFQQWKSRGGAELADRVLEDVLKT